MKLHISSTLVSAHQEYTPDRQGLLYKRSSRSSSYHPCWCKLLGNLLFYCEGGGDRDPPKLLVLEGCTVELQDSTSEPYAFEISYPHGLPGNRVHHMAAENQETMEAWVRALSTAGFAYLRALTAELEGQFQMLKSQRPLKSEGDPAVSQNNVKLSLPKPVVESGCKERNFSQLHRAFGEDIVRLRRMWQEAKADKMQPGETDLINLE